MDLSNITIPGNFTTYSQKYLHPYLSDPGAVAWCQETKYIFFHNEVINALILFLVLSSLIYLLLSKTSYHLISKHLIEGLTEERYMLIIRSISLALVGSVAAIAIYFIHFFRGY